MRTTLGDLRLLKNSKLESDAGKSITLPENMPSLPVILLGVRPIVVRANEEGRIIEPAYYRLTKTEAQMGESPLVSTGEQGFPAPAVRSDSVKIGCLLSTECFQGAPSGSLHRMSRLKGGNRDAALKSED